MMMNIAKIVSGGQTGVDRGAIAAALACASVMFSAVAFADNSLWEARPLTSGDGYTWTLASRTGKMLEMAESLYGPRDKAWTILGTEIAIDEDAPQNWHPGHPRRKDIIFQLTAEATNDIEIACYQLAHEVVHALSPKVGAKSLVIEEGAAACFAAYYVKTAFGKERHATLPSYKQAELSVCNLLRRDPKAIRKLRSVEPCFKNMTPATFSQAKVTATEAEIKLLLSPFVSTPSR